MSLYRKHRPRKFSELIAQEHISKALQSSIENNSLSHAYLFSGPRGTGKTTTARIMATALNCTEEGVEPCLKCENCDMVLNGTSMFVFEMDAASNNGVEEVKSLIDSVHYQSGGTHKVYIIDEVHELTNRASNALLKTLEEPPENVVFILATTNPEKVLPTIRSRTQHYTFNLVSNEELNVHLKHILELEGKELSDDLVNLAVQRGNGSVRDALTALEQILAQSDSGVEIDQMDKIDTLHNQIKELFIQMIDKNTENTVQQLAKIWTLGFDPKEVCEATIQLIRNSIFAKSKVEEFQPLFEEIPELKNVSLQQLTMLTKEFATALANMRGIDAMSPHLSVELAAINSTSSASTGNSSSASNTQASKSVIEEVKSKATRFKRPTTPQPSRNLKPEASSEDSSRPVVPVQSFTFENVDKVWPIILDQLPMSSKAILKNARPLKIQEDSILIFAIPSEFMKSTTQQLKRVADQIRELFRDHFNMLVKFNVEEIKAPVVEEEEENILAPPPVSSIEDIAAELGGQIIEVES
jgi:DNA polymerase-3 subunit gamma/tau